MLRSSQQIVSHATESILNNVHTNIASLEKANANKPAFSARKIFHVLGQLTDQVSYISDRNARRLQTPQDLSSLRLDSFMSVFNVQMPVQAPRHRSHTKAYRQRKPTMEQNDGLLGFRKIRRNTYNKIQLLPEDNNVQVNRKDLQIYQKQCQQEDKFRQAFEKKIAAVISQKRKTKPKFLSASELKERFSYDYECKRIKVKNEVKNNLISSNKSLTAQLSKDIEKHALPHKLEKTESKTIQTHKVEENRKKSKKVVKQAVQQIQPEIQIQFSNIRTLTENVQCQPGVSLNFEGYLLKSRRVKTEISQSRNQQKKSSRLNILTSLKRSEANSNKLLQPSSSSLRNQSLDITTKHSQPDLRRITNNLQNRSKLTKISIENEEMHKYLLQPLNSLQFTERSQKIQLRTEEEKPLALDSNDKFNIKYIKGAGKNTTNIPSTQQTDRQISVLPKSKGSYLKVRQKLENKMAFISQMKRNFQLGLRHSNITENLQGVTH